jgi:hypothetical protein
MTETLEKDSKRLRRHYIFDQQPEAGVLNKLSLAGLAKLSRLRYS